VHKQFCKIWQATADTNGEGVRDIKKKMGEFLWLVRGVPDYTDEVFQFFIGHKREDPTSDGITVAFRSIRKALWGVTSQTNWTFRMRSPFGNLIRRHLLATLG
jgi:hypothetical protein